MEGHPSACSGGSKPWSAALGALEMSASEDFVDIKLDARNLIEADVKSALTDLDWFGKAAAMRAYYRIYEGLS